MEKGVLIVEDDAVQSIIERRIIEHLGYRVLASVHTGKDAIQKVRDENPDLILMDIFLRGELDGIETMKEIRKNSTVPVIYLSGSKNQEYQKKAQSIGPIDFLTKPVSKVELRSSFEKAFINEYQ